MVLSSKTPNSSSRPFTFRNFYLAVFPPILPLQFGGVGLELRGSGLKSVRPVVQLGQLLISLQDFVHVHPHDVHHLRNERQSFTCATARAENKTRQDSGTARYFQKLCFLLLQKKASKPRPNQYDHYTWKFK